MKKYNEKITEVIEQYLTDDDWHFSFDKETGVFEFGLNLDCKIRSITYLICVSNADVVFMVFVLSAPTLTMRK